MSCIYVLETQPPLERVGRLGSYGGLEAKVRGKKGKKKKNELIGELKEDEVIPFLLRSGKRQGDNLHKLGRRFFGGAEGVQVE